VLSLAGRKVQDQDENEDEDEDQDLAFAPVLVIEGFNKLSRHIKQLILQLLQLKGCLCKLPPYYLLIAGFLFIHSVFFRPAGVNKVLMGFGSCFLLIDISCAIVTFFIIRFSM